MNSSSEQKDAIFEATKTIFSKEFLSRSDLMKCVEDICTSFEKSKQFLGALEYFCQVNDLMKDDERTRTFQNLKILIDQEESRSNPEFTNMQKSIISSILYNITDKVLFLKREKQRYEKDLKEKQKDDKHYQFEKDNLDKLSKLKHQIYQNWNHIIEFELNLFELPNNNDEFSKMLNIAYNGKYAYCPERNSLYNKRQRELWLMSDFSETERFLNFYCTK